MSKKDLSIALPEKQDAFSRILRFMTKSDISLNSLEEIILDRWVYCDVLLRDGRKTHEEIIEDMRSKWQVSKFTAMNDINQTQRLFERSRQVSKKYLGHIHLERINQDLQKVRASLFEKYLDKKSGKEKESVPNTFEIQALAKLYDAYTKALQALPDELVSEKQPPPMFVFNVAPGQSLPTPMDPADALAEADRIINMEQNPDGSFEMKEDE
jgi:hypothetical protein